MPSASAKLEKQLSSDGNDPLKQITTLVEKKVRNLEKRKTKLDSYRHDCENGKELNEDQKKAIEKYDQVVDVLEFAKELQKTFTAIIQDTSKAQKKVAKREYVERQQHELQRIKEIMVIQDILNSMGGDCVRNDFLNATNGAVKLSEEELNSLDELFKLICPERDMSSPDSSEFEKQLLSSAEHLQCLLDSRNKEIIGTTYKALKETIMKIHSCNYFNKTEVVPPAEVHDGGDVAEVEPVKENNSSTNNDEQNALYSASGEKQVEAPQTTVDRSFYQNEAPFKEKSRPIQEVLPVQGNLNFLQESQIELESPTLDQPTIASHSVPSGYGTNFGSVTQTPVSQGLGSPRYQQRVKEDTTLPTHMVPSLSAASVPPQQPSSGLGFVSSGMQSSSVRPTDFDPNRPIPTQTFTNQSFASPIHPIMQQNYVPVTLPHGLQNPHILPATMVTPSMSQRNLIATSSGVLDPGSMNVHAQSSGHPMSKLGLANQEAKEHFVNRNFPLHQVSGDSHHMVKTTTSNSQYDRLNTHDAYQSLNKDQSFMSHENFSSDSSSYSGNLKRGLAPRGVPRGSGNRGAVSNASRGQRSGYRN